MCERFPASSFAQRSYTSGPISSVTDTDVHTFPLTIAQVYLLTLLKEKEKEVIGRHTVMRKRKLLRHAKNACEHVFATEKCNALANIYNVGIKVLQGEDSSLVN